MNIILIFSYGISLKKWDETGIIDRELHLYKELQKKHDIHFTFVTFGDGQDEKYSNAITNLKIIPIYKYIKFSNFRIFNFIKTLYFAFKTYKKFNNADLIKTNQLNGSWVGIVLKTLLNIPLIVRTGFNIYEFSIKEQKPFFIRFFYYLLTQVSLILSNIYIVTSNADKKFLNEKFFNSKNIEIIPNWVKNITKQDSKKRYEDKILSVGRLEKQKNYKDLIISIANSEIKLDIVGEGSLKKELKDIANLHNSNVKFLGTLSHSELLKLYTKYKIFVLSSTFEGNPKVVLEAMSCGTLVVAAKNKNVQEIITNGVDGILYSNEEELQNLIKYYMKNTSERNKIIEKAYEKIKLNNLFDVVVEKEFKLYENLIK